MNGKTTESEMSSQNYPGDELAEGRVHSLDVITFLFHNC